MSCLTRGKQDRSCGHAVVLIQWLYGRDVTSEEGERKAAEMKAVYIEMSAKTGINVDTLFKKVVAALPEPTDSEESLERQKCTCEHYKLTLDIRINVDSGNGVQPPSTCNCCLCLLQKFSLSNSIRSA